MRTKKEIHSYLGLEQEFIKTEKSQYKAIMKEAAFIEKEYTEALNNNTCAYGLISDFGIYFTGEIIKKFDKLVLFKN